MPTCREADVGAVLHRLFIGRAGTTLRDEDQTKTREVTALLDELARMRNGAHVVDAAAGKSSVGLIAAEVLPIGSLTIIERDPKRVAACRTAATRLSRALPIEVREADVADDAAWPHAPDVVVALHACGRASDRIIDQAIRVDARWIFVVPCCYGKDVPFLARALVLAEQSSMHRNLKRRIATSIVDAERALRLEASGWETEVHEFVGATVTPHNLLIRARRRRLPGRMADAAARLRQMRGENYNQTMGGRE